MQSLKNSSPTWSSQVTLAEILKFYKNLGHEHKSVFVRNGEQQVFANQKGFVNLNIMETSTKKEIIVPSCNYKLGNTGYGVAIISKFQFWWQSN